eukprot:4859533-Pleurochrysis_carterae.AAC.8
MVHWGHLNIALPALQVINGMPRVRLLKILNDYMRYTKAFPDVLAGRSARISIWLYTNLPVAPVVSRWRATSNQSIVHVNYHRTSSTPLALLGNIGKNAPIAREECTLKLREKCASSYAKRVEYLGQRPFKVKDNLREEKPKIRKAKRPR